MSYPCATLHIAKLYAAPYWATLHPTEFHCILFCAPSELCCCTLLNYAAPYWAPGHSTELLQYWATQYPTELRWTLLSYAEPYWATLNPTELRCTLLSYAVHYWATQHDSLTELPSVLDYSHLFLSIAGLSGTEIRVPQVQVPPVPECYGTGLRCRMPEFRCRRHRPRCRCPAMLVHSWRFSVLCPFFLFCS
jgi:hypothetical protein